MRDLLGYEPEEILGKTPFDLMPPDEAKRVSGIFGPIVAERKPFKELENINVHKDGRHVILETAGNPIFDKNGSFSGYWGIDRDITERKKLEDQLIQSQKMEAVGQLAGGIAHDFNNILTAIIGYASFLQMGTKQDDPLRVHVDHIISSSERAASLTQSLLSFSRKQIVSLQQVKLNETIQKIEKLLKRIIGEDITLETTLSEEDITVMANAGQIEQVIMNLAANARDAMPDGGHLLIETKHIFLDDNFIRTHGFGKPGLFALIVVSDSGTGMEDATQEKIFEPFFTTKETGRGTGLGLSMAYSILKQHNGFIDVYSEHGKGTTFKLYLPALSSPVEKQKPDTFLSLPVTGGSETILIAEDDKDVRQLTREVLEQFGYSVIVAEDGEDAVNKFNQNKDSIQLILLDVIMPKKNGKEVYTEIKNIKPEIKALFISGYTADLLHKKGILEKGLRFVLKPIRVDKLLQKVREILDTPAAS
jgi:PAS domain S-box-containing protein